MIVNTILLLKMLQRKIVSVEKKIISLKFYFKKGRSLKNSVAKFLVYFIVLYFIGLPNIVLDKGFPIQYFDKRRFILKLFLVI